MRKTQTFCDRCGKELPAISNAELSRISARIDLFPIMQNRNNPQRIDLCKDCFEQFVSFMEMIS